MTKITIADLTLEKIAALGRGYYRLRLGPFRGAEKIRAGQFVHVQIPGGKVFFRRAFSVYDTDSKTRSLEILFKEAGRGTQCLAKKKKGDILNVMGPLGNGFGVPGRKETILLAAGGVGFPPIYLLARQLLRRGLNPSRLIFFYGGRVKDDLVDLARVRKLGTELIISTDNGSFGYKGLITEAMQDYISRHSGNYRIYACGPPGMLKAVEQLAVQNRIPGEMSLEAPMPCGIGICLGCILPLKKGGYTRVCRDGPVYQIGEVML